MVKFTSYFGINQVPEGYIALKFFMGRLVEDIFPSGFTYSIPFLT